MQLLLTVLPWLIGLALIGTVATLFSGLTSMLFGGEFDQRNSNKLMRLRIIMQATTVALLLIYFLLQRG